MIVSTKGRYALRVMIDLAEHQAEKYVPLKEVAARQDQRERGLLQLGEKLRVGDYGVLDDFAAAVGELLGREGG